MGCSTNGLANQLRVLVRAAEGGHLKILRRLTIAALCRDDAWYEEIDEEIANHHRTGIARLPLRAQIETGRADPGERLGHVPRPVFRGTRREASRGPAPLRAPPDQA